MSNQAQNNNVNYLIDPTFTYVNRIFVLSFKSDDDRNSFSNYYVPSIEVRDFNVLIDQTPFFEILVKNKEEANEQIIEMSRNNCYTTDNLLDHKYFSEHYKLIAINLSKQVELESSDVKQKTNFTGRLEEDLTIFFIIEKKIETTFDFSQNSVTVI